MEWYQILMLVLGILFIECIFGAIIYVGLEDCWHVLVPMSKDFKNNTKMNHFGCIVCYILLFIIFPIWNIGKVVYWLFHIKRGE
jgi:hypothetical protein